MVKITTDDPTKVTKKDRQFVPLRNGGQVELLPSGNKLGTLPTVGLSFEVEPRKLKHTQKLERAMGGAANISDFIEEAAMRLFAMLICDADRDIGSTDEDRLNWLFENVPEQPDGMVVVDILFGDAEPQTSEIDRIEGDRIVFVSGHELGIGSDGTRIAKFPVSGHEAAFRPPLMGDSNAITRAMGGSRKKQAFPVEATVRTMTRLCTRWDDRSNATMSDISNLKEGEDSQYLAEIYASFRLPQPA